MPETSFILGEKGGCLAAITHKADEHAMNWVKPGILWGTTKAPEGVAVAVTREITANDRLLERYTFTNTTSFAVFVGEGDVGVYAPFHDDYLGDNVLATRCHAHIWCGGASSYVCGLRMGGEGPHLGLIVTKGSVSGYSTERDLTQRSNDRGSICLYAAPFQLEPGASYTLEWELFWHKGMKSFLQACRSRPGYVEVAASRYVLFQGERADVSLLGDTKHTRLTSENILLAQKGFGCEITPQQPGEYTITAQKQGDTSLTRLLCLPPLMVLAESRCRFITRKQQYINPKSVLHGAYLSYDNEAGSLVYSHPDNDRNGGRERVGMGVLLARYLHLKQDAELRASLDLYMQYVDRELFDAETGEVFNDAPRNNDWDRLYNYPWVATLYLEYYQITGLRQHLQNAYKALNCYYERGGINFNAINIPMVAVVEALSAAGMLVEARRLLEWFRKQADRIVKDGTAYAAHEVNYEQSIVAPATNCLLQFYRLTGEAKYRMAGEKQLAVLELFNGQQPDYHMHEVAIRHWDGYWFGKSRLYGDTFPHYWSSLTGNAYAHMASITGEEKWHKKAESSLRASLSLIFPDGSASCACVYPLYVNGERANRMYDPLANDQDWALYFALCFMA